ncbi:MAG TPA: DUF167 domain-containing protein [Candidatus Sulfotelmatobacter sp.]|jgi:uncharacterized protein (TIGR00251 family)|nr:DUF167 domain-containing protein [Candidatus Sulfotelmatobacter sp.]
MVAGGRLKVKSSSAPAGKLATINLQPATFAPAFLSETADGVLLSVKLQPRASKNEIGEALREELRIKVTAPPVDAAANQALVELLAEKLGCARNGVEPIRGHTSRHKTVLLRDFTADKVLAVL